MSDRANSTNRTLRRRLFGPASERVRALLALGLVLGLGATGTLAAWTDSATATSGTFSTGTVNLRLGSTPVDNNPTDFTTSFAMTNMGPGSTKDAVLKVTNSGTLPFSFSATGSATNSGAGADQLGAALKLSVYSTSSGGTCTGTAIVDTVAVNGNVLPTQAALAAGGNRDLCFRASLPSGADTALQNKSSVVTLTFTASNG